MKDRLSDLLCIWGRKSSFVAFCGAVLNFFRVLLFPKRVPHAILRKDVYAEMDKYNLPEWYKDKKARIYRDFRRTYIRDFISLDDYLTLGFYGMRKAERNTYYTESIYKHHYYCLLLNGKESREIMGNKSMFATYMGENFGRHFLDFTPETTREQFDEFAKHCATVFVKPNFSYAGYGIQKEVLSSQADIDDLWERLSNRYYMNSLDSVIFNNESRNNKAFGTALLEEGIVSDPELQAFHPESLNTFRVFTAIGDHGPQVVCAYLRIGVGSSYMDHTSEGAIAAALDTETGIIVSPAMDGYMNTYLAHPDTGKQIVGFRVPRWQECIAEVKRLSLLFPDLHIIGWDMILTADGHWIPVEGNALPGSPLWQYIMHQGIVPMLDKHIGI